MTGLGKAIQYARLASGLTQAELGASIRKSKAWVADVERGKTVPKGPILDALAEQLDADKRTLVALAIEALMPGALSVLGFELVMAVREIGGRDE